MFNSDGYAIRVIVDDTLKDVQQYCEWNKQHIVRSTYTPPVHAWTLRTLFLLTKYYNSIRARGMLSMVTLPLIDLTLQVEFKVLDTLTPVWSHSQTTKPRILKRHLLGIDYITYQGLVGKVDPITPNPTLN